MNSDLMSQELFARLVRIEEKLDRVVRLEERQDRNERDIAHAEGRLDTVEGTVATLKTEVEKLNSTSVHRWSTFSKVFFGVLAFFGLVAGPVLVEVILSKAGIQP